MKTFHFITLYSIHFLISRGGGVGIVGVGIRYFGARIGYFGVESIPQLR